MSIVKNKLKSNYSQLPNELITDMNISAQSYRVMTYLMSLPDGWTVNNNDVCKKLNICEDSIAKYWKELIKSGWITRYEQKRANGRWGNFEYHLNESPIIPSSILPTPIDTDTESFGYGRNTALTNTHPCTNTHSTSNTHINNEKNSQKREIEPEKLINYTNQYGYGLQPLKPLLPSEPFIEVLDYFNKKTNSKFKHASKTIDNLKRVLSKHTIDEVKLVIDYISQDDWYIKRNRVVLPVICRPTLFAEKLAIATSHKNNPNKPRKFNDVDEFPEDNPVEVDYATLVEEEKNKILWSDINDN